MERETLKSHTPLLHVLTLKCILLSISVFLYTPFYITHITNYLCSHYHYLAKVTHVSRILWILAAVTRDPATLQSKVYSSCVKLTTVTYNIHSHRPHTVVETSVIIEQLICLDSYMTASPQKRFLEFMGNRKRKIQPWFQKFNKMMHIFTYRIFNNQISKLCFSFSNKHSTTKMKKHFFFILVSFCGCSCTLLFVSSFIASLRDFITHHAIEGLTFGTRSSRKFDTQPKFLNNIRVLELSQECSLFFIILEQRRVFYCSQSALYYWSWLVTCEKLCACSAYLFSLTRPGW